MACEAPIEFQLGFRKSSEVPIEEQPELKKPKLESEEEEEEEEEEEVPIEVDEDDYWRNDEFYADDENGLHEMNPKECGEYFSAVNKSGGFDVPEFPNSIFYGIQPCYCSHPITYAQVRRSSVFATQGKDYEFYRLVKVNEEIVSGSIYYITFLAEDLKRRVNSGSGSGSVDLEKVHVGPNGYLLVELQAKVYYPIPDKERKINMELMYFNVNHSISEEGLEVVMQFAKK